MNLILSRKAYTTIRQECLMYPEVETGGILIGRFQDGKILVPFATDSGPSAVRKQYRFEPDFEYQQKILDKLFKKHGTSYVGSYHRHFDGFSHPSIIDLYTARHILSSPSWGISKIVFPIILVNGSAIEIYPYLITKSQLRFRPIGVEIEPNGRFSELRTRQKRCKRQKS